MAPLDQWFPPLAVQWNDMGSFGQTNEAIVQEPRPR